MGSLQVVVAEGEGGKAVAAAAVVQVVAEEGEEEAAATALDITERKDRKRKHLP